MTPGETEEIECGLVLRSIGYLGTSIDGVPHDASNGVIPNKQGRVVDDNEHPIPGQYVVGWIKRGPSGVIGTNKKDAQETVDNLLEDAAEERLPESTAGDLESLPALLRDRDVEFVEFDGWEAIDALEQERGETAGPAAGEADRSRRRCSRRRRARGRCVPIAADLQELEAMIVAALPGAEVEVVDEGGGDHLRAIVSAPQFEGRSADRPASARPRRGPGADGRRHDPRALDRDEHPRRRLRAAGSAAKAARLRCR